MPLAISPHFQDVDFPSGMSLDQMIEVFADQVTGWQLDIAQQSAEKIANSGFAVLNIVFSYFEMIGKIQDGYVGGNSSKKYFILGFNDVFPKPTDLSPETRNKICTTLYESVRCGLYHVGMTGPNIEISNFEHPVYFLPPDKAQINPQKLVSELQRHFLFYVRQLRDHSNGKLRKNFALFLKISN
jgi:hypothetical protein